MITWAWARSRRKAYQIACKARANPIRTVNPRILIGILSPIQFLLKDYLSLEEINLKMIQTCLLVLNQSIKDNNTMRITRKWLWKLKKNWLVWRLLSPQPSSSRCQCLKSFGLYTSSMRYQSIDHGSRGGIKARAKEISISTCQKMMLSHSNQTLTETKTKKRRNRRVGTPRRARMRRSSSRVVGTVLKRAS